MIYIINKNPKIDVCFNLYIASFLVFLALLIIHNSHQESTCTHSTSQTTIPMSHKQVLIFLTADTQKFLLKILNQTTFNPFFKNPLHSIESKP